MANTPHSYTAPELIPGCEDRQWFRNPDLESLRAKRTLNATKWLAEAMAQRVAASRELFSWKFYRGDCHSHTQHSDGSGTVADVAAMVEAAGLDFQFVTDHWGITQAPECRELGLWFGQEPVTDLHHMGILGLKHAFVPAMDFLPDYHEAVRQGATVFLPHPTGWWPSTVYSEEQVRAVELLPSPFLMEICNGANNIVNAFDYTDDSALQLWDHLLCLGRHVHAMGNTDSHFPQSIGMVWNSVFADVCEQETILAELSRGHSFVSDAALIHIGLGEARMGDTATASDRKQELEVTVADSDGLACLRVVADGEEVLQRLIWNERFHQERVPVPCDVKHYVRAEVFSRDGRRAYSNPIYFS